MAQKSQVIDITRSYIPRDPTSMLENMISTNREDGDEKVLPVIPYEGYNFLPTSYGYRSYFGLNSALEALATITSKVDKVLSFQLTDYTNKLIALCSDGVWLYDAATTTWSNIQALTDNSGSLQYDEWTYTVIENNLYMYRQTNSVVYKYTQAGVLTSFAPSFLNMAGQVGIFRARGRLAFWDSANSIAWSAADDLTNLEPSLETLAGNTIFSAIIGRIVTVKPQGDGFIIYCTKSIVGVGYDTTGNMIWSAQSIKDSTGIASSDDVTQGQTSEEHYVRTNTGFYTIGAFNPISNSRKIEAILPELWDLLKENNHPIKLDCLYDRYLYISTADDTYINAKISQVSQTIPSLSQPLLQGSYYFQHDGVLPPILDAGQISNYLTSLFSGSYMERMGTRYRAKRWTVTLNIVPTAFYCDWDQSVPEGRDKWNDVSTLSTSVGSLPVDDVKISTAAASCLAASGHSNLTGTRVITGVYADSRYTNSAVDAVLGKVYCNSLHYTQETIWDNAVKDRNNEILAVFRSLNEVIQEEVYTNSNPNPEEPLDNTTDVFGTLPDGYGAIEEIENEAGTEVVFRKHWQSGWELTQDITQSDVVVEQVGGGGGDVSIITTTSPTGNALYVPMGMISATVFRFMWGVSADYITNIYRDYDIVTGVITVAGTSTDQIIGSAVGSGDNISKIYGSYCYNWYLDVNSDQWYCKTDLLGNIIGAPAAWTTDAAYYFRDNIAHVSILTANGDAYLYWREQYTANMVIQGISNGTEPNGEALIYLAGFPYVVNIIENSTKIAFCAASAANQTFTLKLFYCVKATSYLAFNSVALAISNPFTGTPPYTVTASLIADGEDYIVLLEKSEAGVQSYCAIKISGTTFAVLSTGAIITSSLPILTGSYFSYYAALLGTSIRVLHPSANPMLVYNIGEGGESYEHTRTTRYYPQYNRISGELGASELRFTQTHTDYCTKKRNGSVTINYSVPVTATPVPAWDNNYPLGIEAGRDYWVMREGNVTGPNIVDLLNALYGGVSGVGFYTSLINSINSLYSDYYYETFHLGEELTITYPGATFVLQDGTPAPLYPTYKGAFVFDMGLKKWGKFKGDHQLLVSFNPVNDTSGGSISYTDFGMKAGILDINNDVKLFDAAPDDSFIRYGKIGYSRLGMTTGYEVKAHFRSPPECTMVVDSSLDGLGIEPALARDYILEESANTEYFSNSARWHTISLYGKFDLQYLEFRGIIAGRR